MPPRPVHALPARHGAGGHGVNASDRLPLLSIRGLTVQYRNRRDAAVTAVRDVSLDIPRAGIVALVGESGSGKTSLAHAVLRLHTSVSGEVLLHGENLLTMSPPELRRARRRVQPVFQDPLEALSPRRSVLQTLKEPLDHFGVGEPRERDRLAAEALSAVGLEPDLLSRYPNELSGGQRQRVALARALAAGPELVVADEPVSALDLPLQVRIIERIRDLRERLGIAFLLVSHDLSVVRRVADTVAVMYGGRLVELGPAPRVFQQPAHPYTQALLRAVAHPDPNRPPPEVLGGETPSLLTPPTGCVFHERCGEALPECASREPRFVALDRESSEPGEHRVRCHLWDR